MKTSDEFTNLSFDNYKSIKRIESINATTNPEIDQIFQISSLEPGTTQLTKNTDRGKSSYQEQSIITLATVREIGNTHNAIT